MSGQQHLALLHPAGSTLSPVMKLPLDIIDRLLSYSSDYYTLRCLVQAAPVFYKAYTHRQGSILLSVCQNEVGDAWPYALALVKAQLADEAQRTSEEFAEELKKLHTTPESVVIHTITRREAEELARISSTATRLEQLFAEREKDVTCATPLNQPESFLFRRALYRFWLLHPVVKCCAFQDPDQLWASMPRQEFLQVALILKFLADLMRWLSRLKLHAIILNFYPPMVEACALEPGNILRLIGDQSIEPLDSEIMDETPILETMRHLLRLHRIIFQDDVHSLLILESIEGMNRQCEKCHRIPSSILFPRVRAAELWGEPNWHWLKGVLLPSGLANLLPIPYRITGDDVRYLEDYLRHPGYYYNSLLNELFIKLESEQDDRDTDDWSRSSWYCLDCLKEFIRERIPSWYVEWRETMIGPDIEEQ